MTKLREKGPSTKEADEVVGGLHLDIRPLTTAQATAAGHLRPATRLLKLLLGDPRVLGACR